MARNKKGKEKGKGWLYAISLAIAPKRFTLLIQKLHKLRLRNRDKRQARKALKRAMGRIK